MFKFIRDTYLWVVAVPWLAIVLGAGLNQAVMIANHDKFPVMFNEGRAAKFAQQDGMIDDYHCVMTRNTRLNALADIFTFGDDSHSSIGDAFIDVGDWANPYVSFGWILYLLANNGVRKRKDEPIQRGN